MGDSGGRSRQHRTGQGAKRRNTPRERSLIDPPWDPDPEPTRYQLTRRGQRAFSASAYLSILAVVALVSWLLGLWFGVELR